MNNLELAAKIELDAGVKDISIPHLALISWFPGPWGKPTDVATTIKAGDEFPLNTSMVVFSMFQSELEYRIYAIPVKEVPNTPPSPPTRYRLAKATRTYGAESMSLDTFAEEMIGELRAVAGFTDEEPDEPDEITCPACGVEVPHLVHCGACGVLLPEDEADETAPTTATPTAAANGTAAPAAPAPAATPTTPAAS